MKTSSSIPSTPKIGALKNTARAVPAPFLIVDPGKRTGIGVYTSTGHVDSRAIPLDELPAFLRAQLEGDHPYAFVVVEDYHLVGGKLGSQQAGSDMPSSIGIGMCRTACEWTDTDLYLVQPNQKREGHAFLDRAGIESYQAATNDHRRDVVDLAGAVCRTILGGRR